MTLEKIGLTLHAISYTNIHICMSHVARSIMEILFQTKSTKYILMTKGELNHLQSFNGYLKKKRKI